MIAAGSRRRSAVARLGDAIAARGKFTQPADSRLRSHARRAGHADGKVPDLQALREPAMHRDTEQARAAERDERADAMRNRETGKRDLGVPITGEQATTRVADAVEGRTRYIRSRNDEQRALRARGADVDTAATAGRVRDAKLGHFCAKQCEHRVRVIAAVFVDREDLERHGEAAQMLCGPFDGNPDKFFVVTKRQDDGDVEPRALRHRQRE